MRILKFLILLLVIFISCEKEEPLPQFNGTCCGGIYIPCPGIICFDNKKINYGPSCLTFEDDRYHLVFETILYYYNNLFVDYGELIWSKDIKIDESGTFKYNIKFKPQSCCEGMLGLKDIPEHYAGGIIFYPENKKRYYASFETNTYLTIPYFLILEDSLTYCSFVYDTLIGGFKCIDTIISGYELKIHLSFGEDCWNSFLEY